LREGPHTCPPPPPPLQTRAHTALPPPPPGFSPSFRAVDGWAERTGHMFLSKSPHPLHTQAGTLVLPAKPGLSPCCSLSPPHIPPGFALRNALPRRTCALCPAAALPHQRLFCASSACNPHLLLPSRQDVGVRRHETERYTTHTHAHRVGISTHGSSADIVSTCVPATPGGAGVAPATDMPSRLCCERACIEQRRGVCAIFSDLTTRSKQPHRIPRIWCGRRRAAQEGRRGEAKKKKKNGAGRRRGRAQTGYGCPCYLPLATTMAQYLLRCRATRSAGMDILWTACMLPWAFQAWHGWNTRWW